MGIVSGGVEAGLRFKCITYPRSLDTFPPRPTPFLAELANLVPDRSVKNVLGSATHTDADIAARGWSDRVVDLELAPGDVSVHHPNIVHGA